MKNIDAEMLERNEGIGFNERLDDIIFRYDLDRCYPAYRPCICARRELKKLIQGNWAGKKIACIATRKSDVDFVEAMLLEENEVDFYVCSGPKHEFMEIDGLYDEAPMREFASMHQKYDEAWLISLDGRGWTRRWLRMHGMDFYDVYDFLEKQDIHLTLPYTCFLYDQVDFVFCDECHEHRTDYITLEIMELRQSLTTCHDEMMRRFLCKKLFFLNLVVRDFEMAEEFGQYLSAADMGVERAWDEIADLLAELEKRLHQKRCRDILVFWIDCTTPEEAEDMPFLREQFSQGLYYSNIYTTTPYTNPTFAAMFYHKLRVDDGMTVLPRLCKENSEFLCSLENDGYKVKYTGTYLGHTCRGNYRVHEYSSVYAPASQLLWQALCEFAAYDDPQMIIVHLLQEDHIPSICPDLLDEELGKLTQRRCRSRQYLNRQLAFSTSFLGEACLRVYMNDHGTLTGRWVGIKDFLCFCGKGIPTQKMQGLYSMLDFGKILDSARVGRCFCSSRKYVPVQDFPSYNKRIVSKFFSKKENLQNTIPLGYKGCVTDQYFYLYSGCGHEMLVPRKALNAELQMLLLTESLIRDRNALPQHRKWAGVDERIFSMLDERGARFRFWTDMQGYDENTRKTIRKKLRYSELWFRFYERALPRQKEKQALFNQLLDELGHARVSYRMGGYHTLYLLHCLSEENRAKTHFIVDNSQECLCKETGVPIISVAEMEQQGVEVLLLSSFYHLETLRHEVEDYPKSVQVVDIYEWMEQHGMPSDHDMAIFGGADEDYVFKDMPGEV